MPLYWLCYRHNNQISVVIEPGASIIHARMHSALAPGIRPSFAAVRGAEREVAHMGRKKKSCKAAHLIV
jgi:hypothetical protein